MKNGLLKKGILCTLTVLAFFSFAACSSKEKDKTPAKATTSKQENSKGLSDGAKTELKSLIEASIKLQYDKTITIAPQELYTGDFLSSMGSGFYKETAKPYKIVGITFRAKDKNLKADAAAIVKIEDKTETYSQEIQFVKLNGTYYINKILLDK